MREPRRPSDLCPTPVEVRQPPRRSERMRCVDSCCWRSLNFGDLSKFFWRRWQKLRVHSHHKRAKRERFALTMNVSGAVTSLDHNRCNMVTSMVAHSGPARKTSGRKRIVITGSQWNHGLMVPTGTTQRDMKTNFIPKLERELL